MGGVCSCRYFSPLRISLHHPFMAFSFGLESFIFSMYLSVYWHRRKLRFQTGNDQLCDQHNLLPVGVVPGGDALDYVGMAQLFQQRHLVIHPLLVRYLLFYSGLTFGQSLHIDHVPGDLFACILIQGPIDRLIRAVTNLMVVLSDSGNRVLA